MHEQVLLSARSHRQTSADSCRLTFFALWKKYSPKSNSDALMTSPSTSTCASDRCHPRGRTMSVARRVSFFSAYDFEPAEKEIVRFTASRRFS